MKWITREHPKIDRIVRPWLIKNFVDSEAEFMYVPKEIVLMRQKIGRYSLGHSGGGILTRR